MAEDPQLPAEHADIAREDVIKILVLGGDRAGGSSVVRRFIHDCFTGAYVSTIGVDVLSTWLPEELKAKLGARPRIEFWDVSHGELRSPNVPEYFNHAHAILMVFDSSDLRSVQAVDQWRVRVEEHARATPTSGRIMSALGIRGPALERGRGAATDTRLGPTGAAPSKGDAAGRRRPVVAGFAPAVVNGKGLPPMLLLANKSDLGTTVIKPADLDAYVAKCGYTAWHYVSAREGTNVRAPIMKVVDDIVDQIAYAKLLEKLKRQLADNYRKLPSSTIGSVVTETNYSSAGLGFDLGDGGASLAAAAGFSLGHRRMHSTASAAALLSSNGPSPMGTRSPSPSLGSSVGAATAGSGRSPPMHAPIPIRNGPRRIASVPSMVLLEADAVAAAETQAGPRPGSFRSTSQDDDASSVADGASLKTAQHARTGSGVGVGVGASVGAAGASGPADDDAKSTVSAAAPGAPSTLRTQQLEGALQTLQELEGKGADFFAELADFLNAFRGLVAAERQADIETLEQQRTEELDQYMRRWNDVRAQIAAASDRDGQLEVSQLFSGLHLTLTEAAAKWRKVLSQLRVEVALAQGSADAASAAQSGMDASDVDAEGSTRPAGSTPPTTPMRSNAAPVTPAPADPSSSATAAAAGETESGAISLPRLASLSVAADVELHDIRPYSPSSASSPVIANGAGARSGLDSGGASTGPGGTPTGSARKKTLGFGFRNVR